MMQLSWRNQAGQLVRDVLQGETWQMLKKGGTSSIYVVIVGLSWLIAAQQSPAAHSKHDTDTWILMEDISWVIRKMKKELATEQAIQVVHKRVHDDDAENLPRKRYGLFLLIRIC